jgi:hypothetical protein
MGSSMHGRIFTHQGKSILSFFARIHSLDTMAAPTYIISRVADPVFALFIGTAAAAVRINREGREKGRTPGETWQAGVRWVQSGGAVLCRHVT